MTSPRACNLACATTCCFALEDKKKVVLEDGAKKLLKCWEEVSLALCDIIKGSFADCVPALIHFRKKKKWP